MKMRTVVVGSKKREVVSMAWTILIKGKQVPSEMKRKVRFRSTQPRKGELRIFSTGQGFFLFRVEDVEDAPRKHVLLVTRLRKLPSEYLWRYWKRLKRHNDILAGKVKKVETKQCRACIESFPGVQDDLNLCPHCRFIS